MDSEIRCDEVHKEVGVDTVLYLFFGQIKQKDFPYF